MDEIHALALDPLTPTTLYLGKQTLAGPSQKSLYKSTDGGATWRPSARGLLGPYPDVEALAINPREPRTLYAATDGRTEADALWLFTSHDGGASWSRLRGLRVRAKSGSTQIGDIVVDPSRPSTLYVSYDDFVSKSTDGGRTWHGASRGLPYDEAGGPGSLVIDPLRPSTLFLGTWFQGVYRTTNSGRSWRPMRRQVRESRLALAVDPSRSGVVYVASLGGVFKTSNDGAGWLKIHGRYFNAVAVDPRRPQTVYLGGEPWDGNKGVRAPAVLKSTDGGATWRRASRGIEIWITKIAIDPRTPSTLYAAGFYATDTGEVNCAHLFKSTDGGSSWRRSDRGIAFGAQKCPSG